MILLHSRKENFKSVELNMRFQEKYFYFLSKKSFCSSQEPKVTLASAM